MAGGVLRIFKSCEFSSDGEKKRHGSSAALWLQMSLDFSWLAGCLETDRIVLQELFHLLPKVPTTALSGCGFSSTL